MAECGPSAPFARAFAQWFVAGQADRDLTDEIAFHIELETEKNVRLGMLPADAKRMAFAHFGGVQSAREAHRDVRRIQWIEDAAADIRFALRGLRRAPVLSATAVVTIALGIGANTAIFSAVNAVVLQPLPFHEPDRLVMVTEENPEKLWHLQMASTANYLDWRDQVPAFANAMAYEYSLSSVILTGSGDTRRLHSVGVTGNFFSTLGVRAEIGRTLEDRETWDDTPATTVLSHAAWVREFGGDPSIIGRSITLDGQSTRIVGVMPQGFAFPWDNVDAWMSFRWNPSVRSSEAYRRTHWIYVIARLKPGVDMTTAGAQLQQVARRLEHDYPRTNRAMGTSMTPLHRFLVGDTRLPLIMLLASVALLLLIACANVGNLLLVHAVGRQREVALRLALGARRGRLVRQAMTESLVLSCIGGACGLAIGWAGTRILSTHQPPDLLRVREFGVDATVTAYVALITVVSGLLFGVAPALWTRRRDPADVLKDGSRGGTTSVHARRWADGLVIAEVAVALVMTTGAGLLVRSAWQIAHINAGFDPHGVLVMGFDPRQSEDTVITAREAFTARLLERARHISGVTSAALTGVPPMNPYAWTSVFQAEGRTATGAGIEVQHQHVSPEYFATMRVALRRGRLFTASDRRGAPPVILINESLARTYFAGQDPIGQRMSFDKTVSASTTWYTVIGVIGDEHTSLIEAAPITVVHSSVQEPLYGGGTVLLRTDGDPAALVAPLRALLREMDPRIIPGTPRSLDDIVLRSMARPRFFAALLGLFALVGLVLTAVGIYGVLAQLARNRAREMGIRIALGAPLGQVRWLVVSHGLRLVGWGLATGGVIALLATRAMTKLLFGVAPTDPATFAGVIILLASLSAAAAWIPAIRAGRADPATALRAD